MSRFSKKPTYYSEAPASENPIQPGGLILPRRLDVYYMDINRSYKYQDLKGLVVYDDDVVKRMVANILATPLGSDHFEPTYGSNVPFRLMNSVTEATAWLIKADTIDALTTWLENRNVIKLHSSISYVKVLDGTADSEGYEVKMVYTVVKSKVLTSFHSMILR